VQKLVKEEEKYSIILQQEKRKACLGRIFFLSIEFISGLLKSDSQ